MGETIEDRAKKHLQYFGMDDHVGMVEMLVGFVESELKRPSVSGGGEDKIKRIALGGWITREHERGRTELKTEEVESVKTAIDDALYLRSTALKPPVGE